MTAKSPLRLDVGASDTAVVPMLKETNWSVLLPSTGRKSGVHDSRFRWCRIRAQAVSQSETRLLNELRESLQQQTATADVLKLSVVPLQSTNGADTLVESATRLARQTMPTSFPEGEAIV